MLTIWLWPWPNKAVERDVVYVLVGVILRFISKRWLNTTYDLKKEWDPNPPLNFQWRRKFKRFASGFLNFLAFLFGWVGLWDLFDVQVVERSFARDFVFFLGPLGLALTLEIFLSEESLLYLFGYLRSKGWKKRNSDDDIVGDKDVVVIIDVA